MEELTKNTAYGTLDASFQAAGGEEGIRKLVDDFYDFMENISPAKKILEMHPSDLNISRDKLFRFLCGWLGGPRLYRETYGPISIPAAHAHLDIGTAERDAWLLCMKKAIELQPYDEEFKSYLYRQLCIPAERVRNSD
ncbi:group II truncated hemoglobin [Aliikangiella sp. IMCC44359]|uniref:group II truncated hemoglobin n=1 Tax=Aliikangiella sp. IMCC44359 TaxID=3459125 RepID=UPI00403ABDC4